MRDKSSDANLADELHVDGNTARRIGSLIRDLIFYQRIREKLGVEVEADEVYITAGSKGNNGSRPQGQDPRKRGLEKEGEKHTTQTNRPACALHLPASAGQAVLGIVERNGNIVFEMCKNLQVDTIRPIISDVIKDNTIFYTDEYYIYP